MPRRSTPRTRNLTFCIMTLLAVACDASAQTQQPTKQQKSQKPIVTLPSLTEQGFEVKTSLGSSLVLQKDKDVWICDMLTVRSNCERAE
jgi:hypothetical protein